MVESDIPAPDVLGNTVPAKTYVYVVAAGNEAVKIGVANNVPQRLKALQTGHSKKLYIFAEIACRNRLEAYAIECRAHTLLKAFLLEGEWFSVSPAEARAAVEKAIDDLRLERRRQEESLKGKRYVPPTFIRAESWMRDPIEAVEHATALDGQMKKEYLVDFGHSVIAVTCGRNRKTGHRTFMTSDVTRWYIRDEDAA